MRLPLTVANNKLGTGSESLLSKSSDIFRCTHLLKKDDGLDRGGGGGRDWICAPPRPEAHQRNRLPICSMILCFLLWALNSVITFRTIAFGLPRDSVLYNVLFCSANEGQQLKNRDPIKGEGGDLG